MISIIFLRVKKRLREKDIIVKNNNLVNNKQR
jgi:hypothetical protein